MEILIIGSDKGLKKKIKRQFSRAASYYRKLSRKPTTLVTGMKAY